MLQMETKRSEMSLLERRRVALTALCDERSVAKYLRGEPMQQMLCERIAKALREAGFADAVRESA